MRYWTKSFARPNLPDCRHNKSRASFVFQSSALYMSAQYLKSQDQTWLSFFIYSKKSLGAHRQFRDQVADFRVFSQQKHEYWLTGKMMRRERERETTIRSSIVKMPLLRLCFCSKGNLTIICNDNRGYGLFLCHCGTRNEDTDVCSATDCGLSKEKVWTIRSDDVQNTLENSVKYWTVVEVLHADALILLLHFWEKAIILGCRREKAHTANCI